MKKALTILLVSFSPIIVAAATFEGAVNNISKALKLLIPVIIGIGLVTFMWGLIQYMTAGGDEKKKTAAKDYIVYGIVGLTVMVSVWALVNMVIKTFELQGDNKITVPSIK